MTVLPPIQLRESRSIDGQPHFRCSKCREWKPEDQFSPNKFTRNGRQSHCKPCKNEHFKNLRAKQSARKAQRKAVEKAFTKTAVVGWKRPKTLQKPKKRKRTALKAMSQEKREWNNLYRAKCNQDTLFGAVYDLGWDGDKPVVIRRVGSRVGYERHHPAGRIKHRILCYVYISPELHRLAHDRAKLAREAGILLPEFDGRESQPGQLDPFSVLPELEKLKKHYEP